MRITKDQRVGGVPALKARQFARDLAHRGSYGCPREWLISFLTDYGNDRLVCDEPQQFLDAFVAEGYAEPVAERPNDLRTTVAGNALAMATARKPVLRRSADQAVADLADRAQAINEAPATSTGSTGWNCSGATSTPPPTGWATSTCTTGSPGGTKETSTR
ncbi:MAG: hypothetical protein M3083_10065 [Actinomycetota bacterium]|nr:hypothetical protein [Actinomycetota bacterium]